MAPLLNIRVITSMQAFSYPAVDYAGPFVTDQGRRRCRHCLFTCSCCRAVHLEIAFSLDPDSFPNASYRMANRGELHDRIISGNGTNFIGVDKEL